MHLTIIWVAIFKEIRQRIKKTFDFLECLLSKCDEWEYGRIICDAYNSDQPESRGEIFDVR